MEKPAPEFEVGDKVWALWGDKKYPDKYPAKVIKKTKSSKLYLYHKISELNSRPKATKDFFKGNQCTFGTQVDSGIVYRVYRKIGLLVVSRPVFSSFVVLSNFQTLQMFVSLF